jgi:putative ABC transport system substrate-binding protein
VTRFSLAFLALVLANWGATAADKSYRLGDLEPTAASAEITQNTTVPELAKLGFQEGTNLVIDQRVGDDTAMPGLAQDLILSRPDAIIAFGTNAILAAHKASTTIPIVTFGPDPVTLGLAASVARPGGHVTGVDDLLVELNAKRLDLLLQAVPMAKRVAALVSRSRNDASERAMREVAASTGAELFVFKADGPDDYPAAFAAMRSAGAEALAMTATPYFYRDAPLLARLALEAGLPTVCEFAETAHFGCLLGYGPDRPELRRRMAHYVAKIFHGAAPGDLPIERPTHYQFAVNLKTAKAFGLTIAPSILARADEVIE